MWLTFASVVICASCCLCYDGGYEDNRIMARPYPAQKKIPFNREIPILNVHKFIRSLAPPDSKRRSGKKYLPILKEYTDKGYTVFPSVGIKKVIDYPEGLLDFNGKSRKKMLPEYGFVNFREKRSAVAPKANVSNRTLVAKANNKKNVSVRSKSPNIKTGNNKTVAKGRPAARVPAGKAKPQKKPPTHPQKQNSRVVARDKKKVNKKNAPTKPKAKKAPKKNLRSNQPRNKNAKSNVRSIKNNKKRNVNTKPKTAKRTQAQPHGRKVHAGRRLIAGRDALIEEYPYVVSIQKDGEHWCAGALLNPRLVITTANCVWKSERVSRLRIRAGTRHSDRGGQRVKVQEMMRHPGWSIRQIPDNDVALLLLAETVQFSNSVHGVDLPNRAMTPSFGDAWVTSWGSDRRDGMYDRLDLSLQAYYGRIMDRGKCNNMTERFGVHVTHNFFCMTQVGKRAPCTRDTGAPAVSDGVLWGLASWGLRKRCGTERFPAMFTYIASDSVINFIQNATHLLMAEDRKYPFLDKMFGN